jgi:predicted DsbA family dithiol-disulfide isomerase
LFFLSPRIEADKQEASALGVDGTPASFINGRKVAGAYPLETFQAIADAELAQLEGAGTKAKKTAARKTRSTTH